MTERKFDGGVIELPLNDFDKCDSFWDVPSKLAKLVSIGERKAFAYKIDNIYVGGCALSIEEDCGLFSYFSVAPDFRRNGIGSCIIDFAVKHFQNIGLKRMRLNVLKNNFDAIRLYEKKGFVYSFDVTKEKIAMVKKL